VTSEPAGLSILVVEDDDSIRMVLTEFLEENGYAVRGARNGRDALTTLADWRPDLIVLDMLMPIMDGHAFRVEQMAHPTWRTIPVIIVSATQAFLSDEETIGARAVIAKPFDFDELLQLVRQWAGRDV
jgi:two-component system chemotaxis response regulator CheY